MKVMDKAALGGFMKNDTSIILPVYIMDSDVYKLTIGAVDNFKQLPDSQLIIIDNGSIMGQEFLMDHADIYIRNKTNLGYAPAVNQGLKLANTKYIVFAENDVLVSANVLDVAKEILEDKEVGTVHFRMQEWHEELKTGDDTWLTGKERWCTFSFFVIKREAMPVGLLDENYIIANYEDWDFLHRVRHINGWKTAYTNKATYKHKDSYTQKKLDQGDREKQGKDNREYFKIKFGNYPEEIWWGRYPDQMQMQWRPFP